MEKLNAIMKKMGTIAPEETQIADPFFSLAPIPQKSSFVQEAERVARELAIAEDPEAYYPTFSWGKHCFRFGPQPNSTKSRELRVWQFRVRQDECKHLVCGRQVPKDPDGWLLLNIQVHLEGRSLRGFSWFESVSDVIQFIFTLQSPTWKHRAPYCLYECIAGTTKPTKKHLRNIPKW
jgi:hypothetical protein